MRHYTIYDNTIHTPEDVKTVLDDIMISGVDVKQKRGKSKKVELCRISSAFDIETSSWYELGQKRASMYVWQYGINGHIIVGRTWNSFVSLMEKISKTLSLNKTKHLLVYVHNLGFEFQFMQKWFEWDDVFYIDDRTPIKAVTTSGIEFRCSYALSGKSLEEVGKELVKYKVEKATGKLDYTKIRNSLTPLTEDELLYCVNDIKVVMSYIQEKIEREGITNIPLTNTGYIRKMCKDACFGKGEQRSKYGKFIKKLTLTDEVYGMLKDAFQGGFVHCSGMYAGKKIKGVGSFDFTTAYPATAIAHELFPMSAPREAVVSSESDFLYYIDRYACLMDVTFYGLSVSSESGCPVISQHKCIIDGDSRIYNGRVKEADVLRITITEQDYMIYEDFYEWEDMEVNKMFIFERGYLPKPIIEVILDLYEKKTKLKGICEGNPELELEYLFSKGQLNSVYGMMVTDIMKSFNSIEDYNTANTRFLYYPWGVWITAINRRMLFTGIYEAGADFVYSDTDSIKILNYKKHMGYIKKYNNFIKGLLEDAMEFHGIDKSRLAPKNAKGQKKHIGYWEFEGEYDYFKGLRAKAYLTFKDDTYNLTVSGVNKREAIKYMIEKGDPFKQFAFGLCLPAGKGGKVGHTYIDIETEGVITDYLGNQTNYFEYGSIHMENLDYTMKTEKEANDDAILEIIHALIMKDGA